MSSQRELMKKLWREYSGDQERVIRAYAQTEIDGLVKRQSNQYSVSPLDYARRLLRDGLAKGWLEAPMSVTYPTFDRDSHPVGSPALRTTANGIWQLPIPGIRSQWIKTWCDRAEIPPESSEYLQRVHDWRSAWRPKRVRILLVAESHVAEQAGDLDVHVILPEDIFPNQPETPGFCRLVYCLGYGEDDLCFPTTPSSNRGTVQYWDLIGAIAAGFDPTIAPQMPRRRESDLYSRLQWKLTVLLTLAREGVWLEDASILGLYDAGVRLVNGRSYHQLVQESFLNWVWPSVSSDQPEQVWVIGRGVGDALQGLPMISPERVISQPQDRDTDRYQADLNRMVLIVTG